jgi:hypothetical protein
MNNGSCWRIVCAMLACVCSGCGEPPGGHWQCFNKRQSYFVSVDLHQSRDSCTLVLNAKNGVWCRYSRSNGKVSITHIRALDPGASWTELPEPLTLTYRYWSNTVLIQAHPMLARGENSIRLGRLRSNIAHGDCEL